MDLECGDNILSFNERLMTDSQLEDALRLLSAEKLARESAIAPDAGATAIGGLAKDTGVRISTVENPALPEKDDDHSKLRESLLATFGAGYNTYSFLLEAKNTGKKSYDALVPVEKKSARWALGEWLTPARLSVIAGSLKEFTVNPEIGSPMAGFDILILPIFNFTFTEENILTERLQSNLPYSGKPFVDAHYHSRGNANTTNNALTLRFAGAPRHFNIPSGHVKDLVKFVGNHNALHPEAQLRFASDIEAVAHINVLNEAGLLNDPATRFMSTWYKDAGRTPFDLRVPNLFVNELGRLVRDSANLYFATPARALIV